METRLRGVLSKCVIFAFALILFAVGGNVAWADSGTASFTYIVFPPGAFPGFPGDIAGAADGQTIQMAGAGPLSINPKSVGGGGTFIHRNAAGAVVATGTWTAVQLLSFTDYGTDPAFPPNVHGGLAIIRIHLTPRTGGAGVDATLWVDCGINQPGANFTSDLPEGKPEDLTEGIRLAVDGGPNFNKKISSATVFLAI